jgi:hypothetical protein
VRYINSLNIDSKTECFILVEPGLGYTIPVLKDKFKNSKIIVLHADKCFPAQEGTATLHCTKETDVYEFLENEVPADVSLVRVIEWRPSMNYYKAAYVKILSQVTQYLKRLNAEKKTVAAFGKRWIKNFFRNLVNVNNTLLYREMDIPVIVTGSGPSLETSLPLIRNMQDYCLIIASSSSVMALAHNGVKADIVITSDGGPWALHHIYPCFRGGNIVTIAADLCASLPSQCANLPRLVLSDSSFWQSIILHELAIPSVIIPQRGTVTASAVELALILSCGKIYLAGMDLCIKDIRTHVRPYSFDHLFYGYANRLKPVYSQSFIRSGLMLKGGGLSIYRDWFKKQLALWPKRIFSLDANHEIFDKTQVQKTKEKNTGGYFKTIPVKDAASIDKKAVSALFCAMKDSRYAENIKAELVPMLFPGTSGNQKNITEQQLEEAIREAAYG